MSETMLEQQLTQLLQMAVFGWVMLLTADEKRILAVCGRWSYRKKAVGDFFFCLVWGLLFWAFLVHINGGLLRNYIFIGLLGGAGLYHVVCRRWCYRFCLLLARGSLWLWRGVKQVLLFPWRLFCRFCVRPCCRTLKKYYWRRQESTAESQNIIENENNFST